MPGPEPAASSSQEATAQGELSFPPVSRQHILHCSYDYWFPKYRTSCIRSRIIPLTPEFISWLHEDGILLANEGNTNSDNGTAHDDDDDDDDDDDWEPSFSTSDHPPPPRDDNDVSDSDSDDGDPAPVRQPPDVRFPALHAEITSAIASLGGAVAPKLNWSSPKDATWISRHPNTMKCTSANDIYILLKSSSFISHDLDHAFDDTVPAPTSNNNTNDNDDKNNKKNNNSSSSSPDFKHVLVLRAFFNPLPSLEFRCFVKDRTLIAITQRDLNYYDFLASLRPQIVQRTKELFQKLRFTFPDGNFVFDVYIPEADYREREEAEAAGGREKKVLGRARLIDINPWAPRTDTILFDWSELLEKKVARPLFGFASDLQGEGVAEEKERSTTDDDDDDEEEEEEEDDDDDEPEVRLVEHDDPAAYNFSSSQYSAHKLPKDVVDASLAGEGGIREFAQRWQRITERRER
ncbi:D123-domain-containing protein [Thermothelomyces heterothallicus CBS 202.75]|uniref:D123-domain-containing protein n=1 Tax=Thermothelomyces heterothallicus CBS 202.75 TaxID=1149848 RepID=UPI0037436116